MDDTSGRVMINEFDIKDMKALEIKQPSVDNTLAERGKRYGSFAEHAWYAQKLKETMWKAENWHKMANDQKQALEVIADKIARVLNGDPDYVDNWHDIQGYAKLVEDRLNAGAQK